MCRPVWAVTVGLPVRTNPSLARADHLSTYAGANTAIVAEGREARLTAGAPAADISGCLIVILFVVLALFVVP